MKIGLVIHPERERATEVAVQVVSGARRRGIEVVAADEESADLPGIAPGDLATTSLVLSIGGDGTVLEAV